MELFYRYAKYFKSDIVQSPQPLSDDIKCSVCLDEINDQVERYTTPCCGKTYHKKCLSDWFIKEDSCPSCKVKLVDEYQRMSASTITYVPVTKEMTWYRYCLWFIGANSYIKVNNDKLIDSIKERDLKSSFFSTIIKYILFKQYLLNDNELKLCTNLYKELLKFLCFIPIFILMRNNGDTFISKMWTLTLVVLYLLKCNMVYFSSYNVRLLMYSNFKNSFIAWIYYVILISFEYLMIIPSFIWINDSNIRSVSLSLISLNIGINCLNIFISLSSIHGCIRGIVSLFSDLLRDELFEDVNIETFIKWQESNFTSNLFEIVKSRAIEIISNEFTKECTKSTYNYDSSIKSTDINDDFLSKQPFKDFSKFITKEIHQELTKNNNIEEEEYTNDSNVKFTKEFPEIVIEPKQVSKIIDKVLDEITDETIKDDEEDNITSKTDEQKRGWFV